MSFGQKDTKDLPTMTDPNLRVELFTAGLNFPTGMVFLDNEKIMIIEKNSGKIKLVINGSLVNEPIIDLNVANMSERGLLGIASSEKNISDVNYKGKKQYNIFLFVTETDKKDGGNILGNRVYKYELIDDELINPKLLLDLPFLPGPSHNGGVIQIGKDNNLYIVVGDLNRKNNPSGNTLAENLNSTRNPDGRGGILFVDQNGEPVGEGILGNTSPINKYFGYGIRNSFGIGFDPITGNLWETENGSHFGDEINLIVPGFNGGWRQVLGLSELYDKFKEKKFDNQTLVTFNGNGKYKDPIFMWNDTIAPTAINFIESDKLGLEYQNDLVVGSVKQGRIFHFDLNENRTDLILRTPLADRIANHDTELQNVTFGRGFGIITDVETNPFDGYLYVLSADKNDGSIYRIMKN
ncbi:MAG: quinoprotein glucose dehydrogenase [Nitrososphaeraceae archaeon]|nr:quinoprotein glucose dehydrogenase [Nitrososphaeraceae archaeon]